MEGLDKRAPFTATGGIIPPEFRNIKTPCYILDEKALIKNAKLLGEVAERTGCKMLLAQKAFSNYDCYQFFEPYLAGTEASGLFEARLGAEEMPEKEVHVFCAGYRADEFEELLQYADHIVFNSPTQLLRFGPGAKEAGKSVGLRINPECSTQDGHEIYDPCAPGSRMGTTRAQWDEAFHKNPELLDLLEGIHFHTLCEQDSDDLETTLVFVKKHFGDLASRVKWINFGGGHHITRPGYDIERLERCIRMRHSGDWCVKCTNYTGNVESDMNSRSVPSIMMCFIFWSITTGWTRWASRKYATAAACPLERGLFFLLQPGYGSRRIRKRGDMVNGRNN